MMQNFAERLNLAFEMIRKEDGGRYTPEDIQAASNNAITASYIWRLRSGKAPNPTIKVVQILSQFFGVQPSYFLDDPADEDLTQQTLNKIAMRSAGLDAKHRDLILAMIEQIVKIQEEEEE